jgi:probable rRNA maturation factor
MPAIGDGAGSRSDPAADADPQPRLSLEIIHDSGDWAAFAGLDKAVQDCAGEIARHSKINLRPSEACIALSSAEAVRLLNRDFRRKDKPTNVLSFPAGHANSRDPGEPHNLGDVVLAAEVVLDEAHQAGISPIHHLQHLVVHGLLHLLGYDHETDQQAATMEALETSILGRLGVADPYRQEMA